MPVSHALEPSSSAGSAMRMFFALPLPATLQDGLASLRARHPELPGAWADPAGLHLTLAFLGERASAEVPDLLRTASTALEGRPAIPLRTGGLGGFPRPGAARILWLGLEDAPELGALAADLRNALGAAGIPFDQKPFRAHITLARFRTARDVARLDPAPDPAAFLAREVVLFRSLPGAHYAPLGRVVLHP